MTTTPPDPAQIEAKILPGMSPAAVAYRRAIPEKLAEAIRHGALAEQAIVQVELMTTGITSIVYRLTTGQGRRLILKMVEGLEWLRAEAVALDGWRDLGVKTPQVIGLGFLDVAETIPFLLLEYVAGQDLLAVLEAEPGPATSILADMGAILARMHGLKGRGVGPLVFTGPAYRGRFDTFQQEMAATEFQTALAVNLTQGRLQTADLATVEQAIALLSRHLETIKPSLVHTDFRAGNILYQPAAPIPYTIIDPAPRLTHPYLCLSYSLILEEIHGRREAGPILAGYRTIEAVDDRALTAAKLLQLVSLLSRWGDPQHPYAKNLAHLYQRTLTAYRAGSC